MSHHPRPEGRTAARRAVLQRANSIKVGRPRHFMGRRLTTRLYNGRQVQQAVCLLRRRGSKADQKLLVAAGYRGRAT